MTAVAPKTGVGGQGIAPNAAVGFLAIYLVLLLLIPAQLVYRPLGFAGHPGEPLGDRRAGLVGAASPSAG